MPRSGCSTMTSGRGGSARTIVIFALVLLAVFDTVSGIPYRRSVMRLCSKSLSDALYLACKDRGYNEPFSYSGEDDPQDSVGPGLAEECCYHTCTYTQLEQYCKPMSDKDSAGSSDAVKEPLWIVNLPYPSTRPRTSSEERSRSRTRSRTRTRTRTRMRSRTGSEIEYVGGTIKCKNHGMKIARKQGINPEDNERGCDGKKGKMIEEQSGKKHGGSHCRCRRRHHRRRRPGKTLDRTTVANQSNTESTIGATMPADQIST